MMRYDEYIDHQELKHGEEFQRLPEKLKRIAFMASILAKIMFDERLKTVSIFRKKTNAKESGIHEYFRAIDFAPLSKIERTYLLIDRINDLYVYDSRVIDTPSVFSTEDLAKRKTMKVAHDNPWHGTNCHIHIQSSDFTTYMTNIDKAKFLALAENHKAHFEPIKLGVS